MKMTLFAMISLLTGGFLSAQTPSPWPTSKIPPKIPVRDFFRNPVSRGYDLSPDGKSISFLQPWESRLNIFVHPVNGGKARRLTSEKDRDIQQYFWKGNDFVIYAMDDRGDENFHLKRVKVKDGRVKDVTPFPKVRSELVDDLEDVSETDILFRMNKRDPKVFDIFRLNVPTGEMKLAAQNPGNIDRYITDHAGKIRAAVTTDGVNTSLLTRPDETAPFKTVLTTNFREQCAPQFYTFDNKAIYASSNIGRDKSAIVVTNNDRTPGSRYLFDKKSGQLTKLVDVAPWLKEEQLAPMKAINLKTRDGLTIHGYLTLPLGREPKNLPVVANPHGGPWARD